jgi:hypothetical protein
MISSAFLRVEARISVRQPPEKTVAFRPHVCPNEWNNGSAPSVTASSPSPKSPAAISALRRRLECVSSAPFGVPVVPDV